MPDMVYEDRLGIAAILVASKRMAFMLTETYKVNPLEITKVRVDGENVKLDFFVGERMLRFKAKDAETALAPNEAGAGVVLKYDPWLAREVPQVVTRFGHVGGGEPPTPEERIAALNKASVEGLMGALAKVQGSTPTVASADLKAVKSAFHDYALTLSAADLDRCFELMRKNYIVDFEMAKLPEFYSGYADEVISLLRTHPSVATSKLRIYIEYLVGDLPDTEFPELAAKGKVLAEVFEAAAPGLPTIAERVKAAIAPKKNKSDAAAKALQRPAPKSDSAAKALPRPAPKPDTAAKALPRPAPKPDTAAKAAPRPTPKAAPTAASLVEREAKRQARIPLTRAAPSQKVAAPPVVAFAGLLFPGLGHLLCGRTGRGAAFFVAVLSGWFFATFGTVIALAFMGYDPAPGYVVGPIVGILIHVAGVVDAYLCACDAQGKSDPRL